jgi:hypothetical protein
MPPGQMGAMPADDYASVVAFLMQSNGATVGKTAMPADASALSGEAWPSPTP